MRFVGLDPATVTGIVAIGEDGKLSGWDEHRAKGDTAPARINDALNKVLRILREDDFVCIEGFAMEADYDTNKVSSGFNWAARLATDRRVGSFEVATPNQLKKFVGASEWLPNPSIPGKKRRPTTDESKQLVQEAVAAMWGDNPRTFNIADAYVLARIAEALWRVRQGKSLSDYPINQQEVITAILHPEIAKEKKKKAKQRRKERAKGIVKAPTGEVQEALF